MAIHNLLNNGVPVYHRFVDNQVLTNDQLNNVLDHINYQDKQSRASLIGVGNVCGIEVKKIGNVIKVSGGVAVTTDGDLIKVPDTQFNGYKLFKDEKAKYGHFINGDNVVELYELKEDTSPNNVISLSLFESNTSISTSEMVFILYLEHYLKELEDCSPHECNAQGREVITNVKILVTTIANAKLICNKDSIFNSYMNPFKNNYVQEVPPLYINKVVINSVNGRTVSTLKNAYAIDFSTIRSAIIDTSGLNLFKSKMEAFPINLSTFFNTIYQSNDNFQYVYDFYKDLVNAFNDLANGINEEYTLCCPDPSAFPKHIMRGGLNDVTNAIKHKFYPSPIHEHNNSYQRLMSLFSRILEMIISFDVSMKNNIEVVPSRHHHFELSMRALPFYYNLDQLASPLKMINAWRLNQKLLTPNYYRYGYPTSINDPLDFCLDGHDFYRIEGHVGRNVISAMQDITAIRNTKGLGFDVLPIAVGNAADENTLDYEKYSMYFEDLQIILQAWNEEIKCILENSSKFLSNFSTVDEGVHLDYQKKKAAAAAAGLESIAVREIIRAPAKAASMPAKNESRGIYDMYAGYVTQTKENAIIKNIVTNEGSTGSIWKDLITKDDNINDIRIKLEDAVGEKMKEWSKEMQDAALKTPSIMLGAMKVSDDDVLQNIEDFSEENLERFIDSLNQMCTIGKGEKKKLQSYAAAENSVLRNQEYLEQYYFVLNNIISICCMIERFKVLYSEIIKRKQELLNRLVLKEYVKYHPSAEHKAGVAEGGTFILLYYSSSQRQDKVRESNAKEEIIAQAARMKANNEAMRYIALLEEEMKRNRRSGLIDLSERPKEGQMENAIFAPRSNTDTQILAEGTVIGDLCLPYICCSETPATTFVFPDKEIDLFVGQDHVCMPLEGKEDLVVLEPTPSDGAIVASIEGEELKDTITSKDGNVFFDPNKVNKELYGQEISFTVNGQNVSPKLVLYLRPEPSFTVSEPTFSGENTQARIEITNTSQPIAGQTFEWSINGVESQNQSSNFTHPFDVIPGESFTYFIELIATNGNCSVPKRDDLDFDVPTNDEEIIDLTIGREFICFDPAIRNQTVLLTPIPAGAVVKAFNDGNQLDGVVEIVGSSLFFNPNNLNPDLIGRTISFTVNDQEVDPTLIVILNEKPTFSIIEGPDLQENNTKLKVKVRNTSNTGLDITYSWIINGIEKEGLDELPIELDVTPGTVFPLTIELVALNGQCDNSNSETFNIEVPKQTDTNTDTDTDNDPNCKEETLIKINAGNARLEEFKLKNKNELADDLGIYENSVLPIYDLIKSKFDSVMNGEHDTLIKGNMKSIQNQIEGKMEGLDNPIIKQWYLRIYFEMMLLFFYIQACRGKAIKAMAELTGKWKTFVTGMITTNKNIMIQLMTDVPYTDMLKELLGQLKNDLSQTLKELLTNIIDQLNELIGQ